MNPDIKKIKCFLTYILAAALSGLAFTNIGFAQSVSVQGIVTDVTSGAPLEGANVLLTGLSQQVTRGSATGSNGYYLISGIQTGDYLLHVSHIGYETYRDTLQLAESQSLVLSIAMVPDEGFLEELVVEQSGTAITEAGRQRITAASFSRVPVPAGSGDLASFLQTLPGVVAAGDRGGQLFVRGGTPAENMVLMDGMLI